MANYRELMRRRPALRDYLRNRKWQLRGEIVGYLPDVTTPSVTIDRTGYRRSVFRGKAQGIAEIIGHERYGLVLGASNVFGFGLDGDEHTMASVLGELMGFPFANISFPEAQVRNLHAVLLNFLTRVQNPPAAVLLVTGGDFTSFCYSGLADPVFGTPNVLQTAQALKERGETAVLEHEVRALLASTSLWVGAVIDLCASRGVALACGEDITFFEKAEPSQHDIECEVGVPRTPAQDRQYAIHKAYVHTYGDMRRNLARHRGVPFSGPGNLANVGMIDEFHYDEAGTRWFAETFVKGLEEALRK